MNEQYLYLEINENTMLVLNELLNNGYEILLKNDGAFKKVKSLYIQLNHIDFDETKFYSITEDQAYKAFYEKE
jgi:hypothetical protein